MVSINIPYQTEILFAILSYLLSQCIDFFDVEKNDDSKKKNNVDE